MNALLDPIGFIADSIAIANALGIYTPAQQEQTEKLMQHIEDAQQSIEFLTANLDAQVRAINDKITTSSVIEVRSRVQHIKDIPSERIELLIKLLFYMKQTAHNIVFAIIVKYQIGRTVATLGFAGSSADAIEELVQKVNDFYRAICHVSKEMTTYITVRIRGKFDVRVQNACISALTLIATDVCGLSRNVELSNERACALCASGAKTVTLLQPTEVHEPISECDRLCRTFLVGDTRSGKSTLGNALLQQGLFSVSKGMTGTMRIERGERSEWTGTELCVTEIYDTPGLNDKDGLDVLYQTAIEDQIRMLQRASSLIMTVSVQAGITSSASKSLTAYKNLFGDSMSSMLIVVLTVNDPADGDELLHYVNLNWPTVCAMDDRIKKRHVFCVSLYDLREDQGTASHKVVEDISDVSRSLPMKVIEALQKRYQLFRESLTEKSVAIESQIREIMDEGWQAYDGLTDRFENSPYVKLTDNDDGFMNGFVMKGTNTAKKMLAYSSFGFVNAIRKTAIHVNCQDKTSNYHWQQYIKSNDRNRHSSNLMRSFGDILYRNGLGVSVTEMRMTFVGTLRVRRYKVCIFDPMNQTHEELRVQLQKLLNEMRAEEEDELGAEVINELAHSLIPLAIRYSGKKKKSFPLKRQRRP